MKKLTAVVLFLSLSLLSGCGNTNTRFFQNEYAIPETLPEYRRIDTKEKNDWKAQYIWDDADPSEENVWMCFRKTFELQDVPAALTAFISADSKYWLYINGNLVVFEGGVKRGPTAEDSYYDEVPLEAFLRPGKNVISALVWYWGKDGSYSYTDSGRAGFLFEAGEIISDNSWKVCRNEAYGQAAGGRKPNYRLPEFNIYYDARKEPGDWCALSFDDSAWSNATQFGTGGCEPWGKLYPRGIPLLRDYGLKDYKNSGDYQNKTYRLRKSITLTLPYNAQCTPYFKIEAPAGKKIRIKTENSKIGSVRDTYITKSGVQTFEALGWFNGENVVFDIPSGVRILELKYRETGYDTAFSGIFTCGSEALNTLWQKSLRTLYVTMRDNFMDCPDRERAQWWGDVTNEMSMSMYSLDPTAYLLYQKGVACMLGHVSPETKVLQTVVPIGQDYFELPVQQLSGIVGFWTYYLYTGDREFLRDVYDAALNYIALWEIGDDDLVEHREGSWDWMDWGRRADVTAIENAWYYHALSCIRHMADVLKRDCGGIEEKMSRIRNGYASLWTEKGYKSKAVAKPDDRANALAVLSGLADPDQYDVITGVLTTTKNASPYMEYYVLDALCQMGRFNAAKERMLGRYDSMIRSADSTLWEFWIRAFGTKNHAWSGGPLVILSKYFAGIRPVKAGWEVFTIKPLPEICDRLECTVPTVRGYIRLNSFKTDGSLTLETTVPTETKAYISIPYSEGQTVTLDGAVVYRDGLFTETERLTFEEKENGYLTVAFLSEADRTLHFEVSN